MSAEDETKNNGGAIIPPESDAERPNKSGRPASLSSGEDLNAKPEGFGNFDMLREELERKSQNESHFGMFSQPEKKRVQKEWSITVGGLRLTVTRILILSGFLLVFLLCLGACFFYAVKDLSKYRNYARATALFEAGDFDAARDMYLKVLAEDPNKEDAVAAMADIYHRNGDWGNEAFFRQRLMRLNPLDQKLRTDFLESAFRARNFSVIYTFLNLKVMEDADLSPEEGALFVISALQSGHVSNGKRFYDMKRKKEPRYFQSTELGRLIEMKLETTEMDPPRAREFLAFLKDAKDPMVRFETIFSLLSYYSLQGDRESDEKVEELLREATELNNFVGAPLLANYYFAHYRFDDAIKVCEKFLETKINAFIPILLGESLALSGQAEKIPPLSKRMMDLHVRQSRIISLYLDAVNAFCEGDNERLRNCLLEAGSTIETPLSNLMSLQIAILTDSPKGIRQNVGTIIRGRPFMDFQQRARTAALFYLMKKADDEDLASDRDKLNDCAEIAALIQTPGDDVSFLRRIILLDHFNRNVLTEDELQEALKLFPGDAVLLQIASKFYLLNGRPARAMDYIDEYNELEDAPGEDFVAVLHMVTLDLLGRKNDAEQEFRTIVEKGGDDTLLYLYYAFCSENGFIDSLKSFAEWLEKQPKDTSLRSVLPFVRAEILFADDATKNQALELFEKSDSFDPRFVFHAATRLAEAGRLDAALRRYLALRETYPEKIRLYIALSDLYRKKGDKKSELAYAQAAWQENKNDFSARYAYGKCLFEEGNVTDAFSVLGSPQYRAQFPADMLKLWEKVVRMQIKSDFEAARYTPVMENARRLLTCFPDDKEAREYLEKVENIRILEKNSVRQ